MGSFRVCSAVARLYTVPDAGGELSDEMLHGMSAEILEKHGTWLRVRTPYRYEGWAQSENFCGDASLLECWNALPKMRVMQASADIQKIPKVQGKILLTVPRGAVVAVTEEAQNDYRRVRLPAGEEGWIWRGFLQNPPPDWKTVEQAVLRRALVETAKLYYGTQYRWGGKTAEGIDCSGLCSMAYLLNGVYIYRDAKIMPGFPMRKIGMEETKPGDLLFFPGHVAMCLGEKRYIHATARKGCHGVIISSLDPTSSDYLEDLPAKFLYAGSVFG